MKCILRSRSVRNWRWAFTGRRFTLKFGSDFSNGRADALRRSQRWIWPASTSCAPEWRSNNERVNGCPAGYAADAAQTEAFFVHTLSAYRDRNAMAVSANAPASPLCLYFETPVQYSASGATSDFG